MRRQKEVEKNESGNTVMSKTTLKVICENDDLYEYPEFNSKLLLQFKGFLKIENLEEYVNLKTIFLNNNCLSKIENLTHQARLVSLFLNNNLIARLENFEPIRNLQILNLSHNRIARIENLSSLSRLSSLDLSFNILQDYDSLVGVLECPSLTNIDLTSNLIEHDDAIIDIFIQMPILACLYLKSNPCVREFKNYRKRLIGYVSTLKFLDDRPVQENERRVSEAWIRDGKEGEASEREAIMKERDQKNIRNFEEMIAMQEEIARKRKIFYAKAKEGYRQEIERIMKVIEQCKEQGKGEMYIDILTRDLASEQEKLADLEANADKISIVEPPKQVRSFSSTTNPDGSVSIWNRTESEVSYIKQTFFDNPDVQRTKTRGEIEEERQQKLQAERLAKMDEDEKRENLVKLQEEIEEDEKRKREFIDYSTQWKTFMLEDKEKTDKEAQEKEQIKEMSNPQVSMKKLRARWLEGDFDELLENLLLRYVFDFERASTEFNKIAGEVMRGLEKPFLPFSAEDLRLLWTYLEVNKFRKTKDQSNSTSKSAGEKNENNQPKQLSAEELEAQKQKVEKQRIEQERLQKVKSEIIEMKQQVAVSDEITSWETIEKPDTESLDARKKVQQPIKKQEPPTESIDLNDLD